MITFKEIYTRSLTESSVIETQIVDQSNVSEAYRGLEEYIYNIRDINNKYIKPELEKIEISEYIRYQVYGTISDAQFPIRTHNWDNDTQAGYNYRREDIIEILKKIPIYEEWSYPSGETSFLKRDDDTNGYILVHLNLWNDKQDNIAKKMLNDDQTRLLKYLDDLDVMRIIKDLPKEIVKVLKTKIDIKIGKTIVTYNRKKSILDFGSGILVPTTPEFFTKNDTITLSKTLQKKISSKEELFN